MKHRNVSTYGIPLAIVVAGLFIAGAIVAGGGGNNTTVSAGGHPQGNQGGANLRLPDDTDHVRGNPDAQVAIVEFSDLECPFCARLHPTLKRIIEEDANVKWVYRHFPLTTIHSRALSAAVAAECIARLGGNDAFWSFTDAGFADQNLLGDQWYRTMASSFGIDLQAFASCTSDRSVVADIQADLREATATGGRGTPYAIIITASGRLEPFSGALPYEQVRGLVDQALVN